MGKVLPFRKTITDSETVPGHQTISDQMLRMYNLTEQILRSEAIERTDIVEYVNLACNVAIGLQEQTLSAQQQTIDYCTEYKDQVETLVKNNHKLAMLLYRQSDLLIAAEANA